MSFFAPKSLVLAPTSEMRRASHQRIVEDEKRVVIENYLQDRKSSFSVSWTNAAEYDLWFGNCDDLLNVTLYGC